LQNLEADFVPHYIIRNKLIDMNESANIIYSNDHDMLQTIDKNTYVFSKSMGGKKLIKQGNVLKHYYKFEKNYPDEYLPIIMGILGDPGDDVDSAVKGKNLGIKKIEEFIEDFIGECGGVDEIYQNVFLGNPILKIDIDKIQNKYMRIVAENIDIVSRNLKLVSFEVLSKFLDNPNSTELVEKRKVIEDSLRNKKITEYDILIGALEKTGVFITEEYSSLYYQIPTSSYNQGDF
jgi:5'-3' exonuclease